MTAVIIRNVLVLFSNRAALQASLPDVDRLVLRNFQRYTLDVIFVIAILIIATNALPLSSLFSGEPSEKHNAHNPRMSSKRNVTICKAHREGAYSGIRSRCRYSGWRPEGDRRNRWRWCKPWQFLSVVDFPRLWRAPAKHPKEHHQSYYCIIIMSCRVQCCLFRNAWGLTHLPTT